MNTEPVPLPAVGATVGTFSGGTWIAGAMGSTASSTWVAANRAVYIPVRLQRVYTFVRAWAWNGATASGNLDIGLYAFDGTRLLSTGSTAQAGTNVVQSVTLSATLVGPGLYYLAMAMDNATGTVFRATANASFQRCNGHAQEAAAFALPANATPAALASGFLPVFGLSENTTV